MGWVCITDACDGHIVAGVWDGVGMAYFSIADEITILHSVMFSYLNSLSGTTILIGFLFIVVTLALAVFMTIRKGLKSV